ncbi:MAG TPA: hypothetical protein DEQ30_02980 [Porphyromonadaceae bacterium]|nr:hypothetical protein [Porphyromonadaceae bacterium]
MLEKREYMISDNVIKQKFIIDNLRDAAVSAYRFQLNSFNKNLKSKTGATLKALSSPDFIISAGGSEFIVVANVTKQLRLQDLGVRKLYTQPLYVALKHAYVQLQYGFQDDIRDAIHAELENALNPE